MSRLQCQRLEPERRKYVGCPSMFVLVISPVRELSSSSLSNVFLGKYSHPVQGCLEFAQMLLITAVRGDRNLATDSHECTAKRFGNHCPIPSFEDPCAVESNVKSDHGRCRASRKRYGARFRDITRAFRTVNCKSSSPAFFDLPPHCQQSA